MSTLIQEPWYDGVGSSLKVFTYMWDSEQGYTWVYMYIHIYCPCEFQTYSLYILDLIGNTKLFFKIGQLHFHKQCRCFPLNLHSHQHLALFKIFQSIHRVQRGNL